MAEVAQRKSKPSAWKHHGHMGGSTKTLLVMVPLSLV
jgi:hypothetical protein